MYNMVNFNGQQMKWWPGCGVGEEQERSLQDVMKLQSLYMLK